MNRGIFPIVAVAAATGFVAAAISAAPAGAAPSRTVMYDCGNAPQQRPDSIIVYCGDAGTYLTNVRWTSWNDNTATATATENVKLCVPDCASGGLRHTPASVVLTDPVRGVFTTALVTPSDGPVEYYQLPQQR